MQLRLRGFTAGVHEGGAGPSTQGLRTGAEGPSSQLLIAWAAAGGQP